MAACRLRCEGGSHSVCVPCAAVDVAQMPDAPPRGGRGKFTSQLVESYIFELFDRIRKAKFDRVREQAGSRAGPVARRGGRTGAGSVASMSRRR